MPCLSPGCQRVTNRIIWYFIPSWRSTCHSAVGRIILLVFMGPKLAWISFFPFFHCLIYKGKICSNPKMYELLQDFSPFWELSQFILIESSPLACPNLPADLTVCMFWDKHWVKCMLLKHHSHKSDSPWPLFKDKRSKGKLNSHTTTVQPQEFDGLFPSDPRSLRQTSGA